VPIGLIAGVALIEVGAFGRMASRILPVERARVVPSTLRQLARAIRQKEFAINAERLAN
jgi:hypothetical protein